MRVSLVSSLLGVGGAERQTVLWARACADQGLDPTIVVLGPEAPGYAVPEGVEVTYLGKTSPLDLPALVRRLRQVTAGSDAIVAFQTYPALCCALAAGKGGFGIVAGNDPRHWRETSRYPAPAFRWAFRRAARACAPSRGIAACHEQMRIVPRAGWSVIPNIAGQEAPDHLPDERSGALFVGRLVALKNPRLAIDAASEADVPLTVLGDGELRGQMERYARGKDVTFAGFVDDPWRVYASHRVTIVTSDYESFGNMVVESLACATPVVSVDCDFGPREIIGDADYSRLVPVPTEPGTLGAALAEVAARPYSAAERAECLAIAEDYTLEALSPRIAAFVAALAA